MAYRPKTYSLNFYVGIRHLGLALEPFEEGTFYTDYDTNLIIDAETERLWAEATYDPFFAAWAAVNAA
jgi:hypothetical protein